MKKPIIAVDIDDVLSDENSSVLNFINEKYNLSLTLKDYDIEADYWGYWEKVWGVSDIEGAERFNAYISSGVKAHHEVLPDAIRVIKKLSKDYKLVIITAREDQQVDLTHDWLSRHFPNIFSEIVFVHVWSGDKKASKAAIATQLGAQMLIDDNAEHCRLAIEAGLQAILFGDYGWNRSAVLPPEVKRLKDWTSIETFFYGQK